MLMFFNYIPKRNIYAPNTTDDFRYATSSTSLYSTHICERVCILLKTELPICWERHFHLWLIYMFSTFHAFHRGSLCRNVSNEGKLCDSSPLPARSRSLSRWHETPSLTQRERERETVWPPVCCLQPAVSLCVCLCIKSYNITWIIRLIIGTIDFIKVFFNDIICIHQCCPQLLQKWGFFCLHS